MTTFHNDSLSMLFLQGSTMNLSFPGSPSPLGRPPLSPGAQMPKLVQDTELQKLLADEKMRSQMHKTNYEQLKEENKRYNLKQSVNL